MKKFDLYDKQEKCYVGFGYTEAEADNLMKAFEDYHGDILEKRPVNPVNTCLCGDTTDKQCYLASCSLTEPL